MSVPLFQVICEIVTLSGKKAIGIKWKIYGRHNLSLVPLPFFNDDFSLPEIQNPNGEMGDFLHALTTSEHQHEHVPIPTGMG